MDQIIIDDSPQYAFVVLNDDGTTQIVATQVTTEVIEVASGGSTTIVNGTDGVSTINGLSGSVLLIPEGLLDISDDGSNTITISSSALETVIAGISGDLQTQISDIDLSQYTLLTVTESVSGDLQAQIDAIDLSVIDLSGYTLLTTTASLTGDLQTQIDNIVGESTSIESSGGSIIVTQNGSAFNLEVASVADDTLRTEVEQLSGDLQAQIISNDTDISNIVAASGDWATYSYVDAVSGSLGGFAQENRDLINSIVQESTSIESSGGSIIVTQDGALFNLEVADLADGALRSEVESLSADLQSQIWSNDTDIISLSGAIDSIVGESTVVQGDGDRISAIESPANTWTVSFDDAGLATNDDVNALSGTYATISYVDAADSSLQAQITSNGLSIDNLAAVTGDYATYSYVDAVSGSLGGFAQENRDLILAIEQEATVVQGDGDRISVVEAPANTWTVSFDEAGLATNDDVNALSGTYATTTYVDAADSNLQLQITNNDTDIANIVAASGDWATYSYVDAVSGSLGGFTQENRDLILAITSSDTILVGGAGISVLESPTDTWTISVTGDYALNTTVANLTGSLQTQIDNINVSISGAANYQLAFTNGDLVSNVLTVTHDLDQKYVSVTVFDNLDTQIIPDDITLIDSNSLQVDLTSYGVITGTWNVLVINGSFGYSSGSSVDLSHFDPFVIESTPELVSISGSEYYTEIQQSYGNLIAIDADVGTYEEIEVRISSEWTNSQVGTFRLDLDVKSGQTFTFDNSIGGIADVTLPDVSGAASLLFDKPYGTTTWYLRQNI